MTGGDLGDILARRAAERDQLDAAMRDGYAAFERELDDALRAQDAEIERAVDEFLDRARELLETHTIVRVTKPGRRTMLGGWRQPETIDEPDGHVVWARRYEISEVDLRTREVAITRAGCVILKFRNAGPPGRSPVPKEHRLPDAHPPLAAVRCSPAGGKIPETYKWTRETGPTSGLPFFRDAQRAGYDDELRPLRDLDPLPQRSTTPPPPPAKAISDTTTWFLSVLVAYLEDAM